MTKLKKEEHRNHDVWLKCFIKAMKESLRTGLRFYPRDDDVVMLQQIRGMIQKFNEECVKSYKTGYKAGVVNENTRMRKNQPEVTEEWIEEKAKEFWDFPYYDCALQDVKNFIRSLVGEIKCPKKT